MIWFIYCFGIMMPETWCNLVILWPEECQTHGACVLLMMLMYVWYVCSCRIHQLYHVMNMQMFFFSPAEIHNQILIVCMDFLPTQIKCVPSCAEPVSCIMCFGASTHPSIYLLNRKEEFLSISIGTWSSWEDSGKVATGLHSSRFWVNVWTFGEMGHLLQPQ